MALVEGTSTELSAAGRLLEAAAKITVHSGNITSWSKLRKKGAMTMTTTDEVRHATDIMSTRWIFLR